jgi:hypothetical protein
LKDVYLIILLLITDNAAEIEKMAAYGIFDELLPDSKTALIVGGLITIAGCGLFFTLLYPTTPLE